ncbi:Protocadherin-10 [Cichlidogyrus casuarinus]|uniref:Protocadherin-10 n=1 Tax=Cichlidogyrus casuarinus TaxID=1844966 RepID=A0ABD2PZW2_9PLAT
MYKILRGNENDQFQVEQTTGWIYLNRKINQSMVGYAPFHLWVEASDGGSPPRSQTALLVVHVLDNSRHQTNSVGALESWSSGQRRSQGQSDVLILIAMVVATMAALLLIVVMLAVFRCKRWRSQTGPIPMPRYKQPEQQEPPPYLPSSTILLTKQPDQNFYTINAGNHASQPYFDRRKTISAASTRKSVN